MLEHLRCPACRAVLHLDDAHTKPHSPVAEAGGEIISGTLRCTGCSATYAVSEGVPRMHVVTTPDQTRASTASSFGYLWGQSVPGEEPYDPTDYHYVKMEKSLSLAPPRGLVLDAGCGDGIDLAAQAARDGVEVIGVELSDGGCRTSYRRAGSLPRAHVVQADVCRLPFADGTFDLTYSYGVLHHLGTPERGIQELARVAKRGAPVVAYLYEDFEERGAILRWALHAANTARAVTTRMPNRLLYALCRVASPFVFAVFTVPARLGAHIPAVASIAGALPFRHGTGPFSLVGDLFDRLSAPVEYRYSRSGSERFFTDAGLRDVRVAFERGWMVTGVKANG